MKLYSWDVMVPKIQSLDSFKYIQSTINEKIRDKKAELLKDDASLWFEDKQIQEVYRENNGNCVIIRTYSFLAYNIKDIMAGVKIEYRESDVTTEDSDATTVPPKTPRPKKTHKRIV